MGIYFDLGRPVIGGWMGGPWLMHDPVRNMDLIWAGEYGQEGAVLFAIHAETGEIVEHHRIGAREFFALVDTQHSRLWIYTYHGLRQPGHLLLSWSPQTRQLTSHGFPPVTGHRFVGAVLGQDGRVYLGAHPHGYLFSFDPATETWRDHGCQAPPPIISGQHIWCRPLTVGDSGEIICSITRTPPQQHIAFHPASGETRLLAEPPVITKQPGGIPREIDVNLYQGTYTLDGEPRRFHYQPSVATDIVGLNKGPDGRIYGSTIISMHLFCFDPQTRRMSDLGRVGWGSGEIYDTIAHNGKLYMGSYTGAYWGVYDPAQPWNPRPDVQGAAVDANPRCFGRIGHHMNRPFEYTIGPDQRIYIACRADYGYPGGGLARFDPVSEEMRVFRDEAQSVQSITADERYVYGGTSISGGRGSIETTRQAKLFVFDPQAEQRIYECIPIAEAIAVTSLTVSPLTRLVYGATDTGHLFAYDRDQRQVIQRWLLRSTGAPLMGVPETYGIIHLTTASDGDIYGVTSRDLFKLDVSTDQVVYLDSPPIPDLYQIVEGDPGVFYIGARGHLLEYHLKDTPHYR
jgi:hypothetical protein